MAVQAMGEGGLIHDAVRVYHAKWSYLRERKDEGERAGEYKCHYEAMRTAYWASYGMGDDGLDSLLSAMENRNPGTGRPLRIKRGRDEMWVEGAKTCYLYRGYTIYSFDVYQTVVSRRGVVSQKVTTGWAFCEIEEMEFDANHPMQQERLKDTARLIDRIIAESERESSSVASHTDGSPS